MAENENVIVTKELAERADAELRSLLASKTEELHKTRFKHELGQLSETHILRSLKRDVARLSTVLRQRAIATSKEQQA